MPKISVRTTEKWHTIANLFDYEDAARLRKAGYDNLADRMSEVAEEIRNIARDVHRVQTVGKQVG